MESRTGGSRLLGLIRPHCLRIVTKPAKTSLQRARAAANIRLPPGKSVMLRLQVATEQPHRTTASSAQLPFVTDGVWHTGTLCQVANTRQGVAVIQ